MDKKLLEILACPLCKGEVLYDAHHNRMICKFDRLAFPIQEEIPIMLQEKSIVLAMGEGI